MGIPGLDKITKSKAQGGFDGVLVSGATISFSPERDEEYGTNEVFDIAIVMYNLSHDQSALAGNGTKTYSGKFYVDNVVC